MTPVTEQDLDKEIGQIRVRIKTKEEQLKRFNEQYKIYKELYYQLNVQQEETTQDVFIREPMIEERPLLISNSYLQQYLKKAKQNKAK